jgi:hypothetical protein
MESGTFEITVGLAGVISILGMFTSGLRAYVTISKRVEWNQQAVAKLESQLNNGIRDRVTEAEHRLARLEAHHEARESRQRRRQHESDA